MRNYGVTSLARLACLAKLNTNTHNWSQNSLTIVAPRKLSTRIRLLVPHILAGKASCVWDCNELPLCVGMFICWQGMFCAERCYWWTWE